MRDVAPYEAGSLPLDVRIALRLANTGYMLACLVGLCFAPIGYVAFRSSEFAILSVIASLAYLSCHLLASIGWKDSSRLIFVLLMCLHYGVALKFVGSFVGLETLLVPVIVTPLLVFAKSETGLIWASYGIIAVTTLLSEAISRTGIPLLVIEDASRQLAYYGNIAAVAVVIFFLTYTYSRASISNYMKLQVERNKSDQMLRELLPSVIADQMIRGEKIVAKSHGECTVLFADLVGFTRLSEVLSPTHLVELLNEIFSDIDKLSETYGVEKIKTIGDCYMAAAGALTDEHQVEDMALLALAIVEVVKDYEVRTGYPLAIRVGINTGQVISGLIGTKRRLFDVWGQTVNVAQMMEAHSEKNRILVSESTRWRLKDRFEFTPHEPVAMKSGYLVNAYFLEGRANGA